MNQVSRELVFVPLIQVSISQFVVANSVRKHVIDGHHDFVGHRRCGPLVSAPSFETVQFVPEVSALGFCCRVGSLHGRFTVLHSWVGRRGKEKCVKNALEKR
jgi:hypothetical protein